MRRLLATLIGLTLLAAVAHAAEPVTRAKTGDRTLDAALQRMDTEAKGDPVGWMQVLSTRHNIPQEQIRAAQETHALAPADLYMATAIAQITQKPVMTVAETYSQDPGRGWGAIAKDMGIKPGSPQFHQLKKGARGSLDRMKADVKAKQKMKRQQEREHEREHATPQGSQDKGKGKGRY